MLRSVKPFISTITCLMTFVLADKSPIIKYRPTKTVIKLGDIRVVTNPVEFEYHYEFLESGFEFAVQTRTALKIVAGRQSRFIHSCFAEEINVASFLLYKRLFVVTIRVNQSLYLKQPSLAA